MANRFSCSCGKTIREGEHPFRCETCPDCKSIIVAEGEEFDEPLEHSIVDRVNDSGVPYKECKRCRNKIG